MRHLVVGNGEVGSSLARVLKCPTVDIGEQIDDKVKFLHICFRYGKNFEKYVKEYQDKYRPEVTVIHSTVPIGTSKKLGAWHSPIRGVHPNLEQGIKTFYKFVSRDNHLDRINLFIELDTDFETSGITLAPVTGTENTEAGKLLSTTYYAWNIVFEKWVHEYCEKHNLDFNVVYTIFNKTYNEGYKELGMEHVVRPVLKHVDGPIGGHCQIPNAELLKDFEPAKIIVKKNDEIRKKQTKKTPPSTCSC